MNVSDLSGPILGAIIGYGTNWLAIKMLFRPLKPIKIGKFTLPFTPGIIPKRREGLAKAIGDSVGNHLFTRDDMEQMLLSEEVENAVVNGILTKFEREDEVKTVLLEIVAEDEYEATRENWKNTIGEKIQKGLLQMQIGEIIVQEGGQVIREKVKGSMLRMFVTDGLIDSILEPMGIEIEKYVREHGEEKIGPVVEIDSGLGQRKSGNDDKKNVSRVCEEICERFVAEIGYFACGGRKNQRNGSVGA